jgi:hypothetical protein
MPRKSRKIAPSPKNSIDSSVVYNWMYAKYTLYVQFIGTLWAGDTFSKIPTRYIGGIQQKERLIVKLDQAV